MNLILSLKIAKNKKNDKNIYINKQKTPTRLSLKYEQFQFT